MVNDIDVRKMAERETNVYLTITTCQELKCSQRTRLQELVLIADQGIAEETWRFLSSSLFFSSLYSHHVFFKLVRIGNKCIFIGLLLKYGLV